MAQPPRRSWRGPCRGKCCSKERLQFVHIPKAAGTAIEDAAARNGTMWGAKLMWHEECNNLRSVEYCSPWHLPPAWLRQPNFYVEAETFCVVRDPVERAVSQYSYILANKKHAAGYYALAKQHGCSAAGLNAYLNRALRSFAIGDHFVQNCHFVEQAEYIWGPSTLWGVRNRQWCDHILKFEELPEAFNELMSRKGYAARLTKRMNQGVCKHMSSANLTDQVMSLLLSVYSEDFRLLNYSMLPYSRGPAR